MEKNEIISSLVDVQTLNGAAMWASEPDFSGSSNFVSKALTDYVTAGIDEHHDNGVVKIMAAAMQIASESGVLETPASSPLQSAVAAYDIANNLNLSYLVDKGTILAEQAADTLIDNAAVNASIMVEIALAPKTLELGMDRALDAVSAACPPLLPAAQFMKQFTGPVANFISSKVKPIVHSGIQAVTNIAKQTCHSIINKAAKVVTTTAKSMFKKALSIFS